MSDESLNTACGRSCIVDSKHVRFLAMIAESEFASFKLRVSELRAWPSYDDFVMERDGYFLGLSWAGENVVQVDVPFRLFGRWIELTGAPSCLKSLDDFAMRRSLRSKHRDWRIHIVSPLETSYVAAESGLLYVPVHGDAGKKHAAAGVSAERSDDGLAAAIAAECLDPAE